MSSKELKIGDVVYGVGGAFNKRLGRVTKVNPSKPAVEDGMGHRGCYWKLNLSRVGTIDSRFGYCSICKRPSEYDQPCPYSASGGKRCQGVIRGNYDWKLKSLVSSSTEHPKRIRSEPMSIFLAKQLGAALSRLGLSEVSDDIIEAIRSGLKDSTLAPRDSAPALRPVSPSVPIFGYETS